MKSTTYKSLQIGALIPIKVSDRELSNNVYSQLYMGDAMNSKMGSLLTNTGPDGGTDKKMLYNTYAGSVACYQNVEIPCDVNTFVVNTATGGTAVGQTIEIRFGSADAPVAASVVVPDSGWQNYVTSQAKLKTPIKAGTYDVYITFTGSGTTNAWWFGFQNRMFDTVTE